MKRIFLVVTLLSVLISAPALASSHVYTFFFKNLDNGQILWEADYLRSLPNNVSWADGNRAGYKCEYGILLHLGKPIGRVTMTRIDGAEYIQVNDRYMPENQATNRHWNDGTLHSRRRPVLQSECPAPDADYSDAFNGPSQLPTVTFVRQSGSLLLETRNYKTLAANPHVTFQQINESLDRITIIAYWDGNPVLAIYYDILPAARTTYDVKSDL